MGKKKKEIVNFIKEREFGDKIGAPIYFFIQEFKPFSKTLLRFAGPWLAVVLLATSLLSSSLYNAALSNNDPGASVVVYFLIIAFFMMFGFLTAVAVTHSYIALYVKKGKGNFSADDVGELMKQKIVKIFLAGLLVYLMVIIGFIFLYIPGIYLAVAMSFFSIVIVYEDASIGESISRSFKIIKNHWWETFGLIFIFGMIIGFASYIFIIPIYVVVIVAAVGGKTIGAGSVIFIALFVSLYFIAYVFFISLQQILIGFQYFSLVTKKEGLGLKDRIAAINKDENENKDDVFENTKKQETTAEKDEDNLSEKTQNKEQNRFLDKDDNDRFKPKY